MELLTLVNAQDEVIGSIPRDVAHSDPKYIHREVLLHLFDDQGNVLMQRRALTKKAYPGLWVESVAGHVLADEDPLDTAKRELQEELGITDATLKFHHKEYSLDQTHHEAKFYYIYSGHTTQTDIKIDPAEVAEAKWIPVSEVEQFIHENVPQEMWGMVNYRRLVEMLKE